MEFRKRKIKQSNQANYGFTFSFSDYKKMYDWNFEFDLYISSICHMFLLRVWRVEIKLVVFIFERMLLKCEFTSLFVEARCNLLIVKLTPNWI